jgi:hypothetical protein
LRLGKLILCALWFLRYFGERHPHGRSLNEPVGVVIPADCSEAGDEHAVAVADQKAASPTRLSKRSWLLLRGRDLAKHSIKLAQNVASCPLLNSSANARTKGEPLTGSRIKNAVSHPVLPP